MQERSCIEPHRTPAVCAAFSVIVVLSWVGAAVAQVQPVCVQPPAGMVAWWPGDGSPLDIVGGNTGTWHGTEAYATGEVGQAFSFNGSSWVEAPSTAALSPTAAITIDAWINPSATSANRIVDKIAAGGGNGYLLDLLTGKLRLIIDGHGLSGATTLQTGVICHVAGTFDGTTMIVYVNGASDGTFALSGAIPTNTLPVRIGADSTGANTFSGWIDEVEIFNRALSAGEIQGIYTAGPAGKCKPQPIPASSRLGLAVLVLLVAVAAALLLRR